MYEHRLAQALVYVYAPTLAWQSRYVMYVCNTQELYGTPLVYLYRAELLLVKNSGNHFTPQITNTLKYRQTHTYVNTEAA